MPMDQFFEAWAETAFRVVAQRTGGTSPRGTEAGNRSSLQLGPSISGIPKWLVPDICLVWNDLTLIVDAKYKRHWEELQRHSWSGIEEELREQHRNDLLQVLAYANLACTSNVIACLAYPCSPRSWDSLRARGRLIHKAEITIGIRSLQLWLTAASDGDGLGTNRSAPYR